LTPDELSNEQAAAGVANLCPGAQFHLTVRTMRQRIRLGLMVVDNIGGGFEHASAGVAHRHARFKRMVAEPAYDLFYKEGHVAMLSRTAR